MHSVMLYCRANVSTMEWHFYFEHEDWLMLQREIHWSSSKRTPVSSTILEMWSEKTAELFVFREACWCEYANGLLWLKMISQNWFSWLETRLKLAISPGQQQNSVKISTRSNRDGLAPTRVENVRETWELLSYLYHWWICAESDDGVSCQSCRIKFLAFITRQLEDKPVSASLCTSLLWELSLASEMDNWYQLVCICGSI